MFSGTFTMQLYPGDKWLADLFANNLQTNSKKCKLMTGSLRFTCCAQPQVEEVLYKTISLGFKLRSRYSYFSFLTSSSVGGCLL